LADIAAARLRERRAYGAARRAEVMARKAAAQAARTVTS
jgi:hypothetical protein